MMVTKLLWKKKQQQVLSTIVLMLDVITSFNFAASLVDGCCVNVKLSSLAPRLLISLLTCILYSLLYCTFCCLSPETVRVLYIVTRPHDCSCAYFVFLFYTRLFSSFHKLRVMPLRSLNPQWPYCPVAIAMDDAHSYVQHLSPQISRCDVTPHLALWHNLFPAIHPMLQRNQRRYHVKSCLEDQSVDLRTMHIIMFCSSAVFLNLLDITVQHTISYK
jgi:hypothetical protein